MARKSRLESIKIPNPCAEDWNKMDGNEKFRFCGICEKNVYNISSMTTREANKLLFDNKEKVCIRMEKDTHGKVKTLKNPLHQITRQTPIAAGILTATLVFSSITLAQGEPVRINSDKINIVQTAKDDASKPSISGTISDQQEAVIPGVNINLRNVKDNSFQKTVSNNEGFFRFSNIKVSDYEIVIEQDRGFKSFIHKNIEVDGKSNLSLNIALESEEPTTIGVFADDREIKLSPAKIENKLNLTQIEKLPIVGRAFSLDLAASAENKQSDKTSQISFTIADESDAVIPGAEVILVNRKTRDRFSGVSNELGIVNFSALPIGKYEMRVSASGFEVKKQSLKLKEQVNLNQKVKLSAGNITMGIFID